MELIDAFGVKHESIDIEADVLIKPIVLGEERTHREYIAGLRHFMVDGVEVPETEFRRLFPQFK